MSHITHCIISALRHPRIALMGAREFRSSFGMGYDNESRSDSYDAGRELAHLSTFRRYDW